MAAPRPRIGLWYENPTEGDLFKVLDVDNDAEIVTIQYVDGNTSELEFASWGVLDLERVDPPDTALETLEELDYEEYEEDSEERPGEWAPDYADDDNDDLED